MTFSKPALIVSFIFLFGCGTDDGGLIDIPGDEPVAPGTPGSVTCKIDGENFSASGVLATGVLTFTGDFYAMAIGGVDFFGQDTVGLALAMSGNNFATVMQGQVFTGEGDIINTPLGAGEVNINQRPGKEIRAESLETKIATITITKLDQTNELVSGTFTFQGLDTDNNTTIIVADGVFADIPYN